MNVSSNSLFHFTDNIEIIKNILSDKFYGSFCKETLRFDNNESILFVPMISFCDISLPIISNHTKYGKFGIGMTKDWGTNNQLNPVLYHEKNSSLSYSIVEAFKGGFELLDVIEPEIHRLGNELDIMEKNQQNNNLDLKEFQDLLEKISKQKKMYNVLGHIRYSLLFTKHYNDDLIRNGEITRNYNFYDEREWRFVPKPMSPIINLLRNENDYKNWRGETEKKPILDVVNLSFKSDDVEYIIVEHNNQKKEMREFIKNISQEIFNQENKEDLYSKIISFEQLKTM